MSRPIPLKIYGDLRPVELSPALEKIAGQALPPPDRAPIVQDGDIILISFEGIYFPLDEILDAIKSSALPVNGKIDALDLDAWILTRYLFENGEIEKRKSPLNNVLAWSGH